MYREYEGDEDLIKGCLWGDVKLIRSVVKMGLLLCGIKHYLVNTINKSIDKVLKNWCKSINCNISHTNQTWHSLNFKWKKDLNTQSLFKVRMCQSVYRTSFLSDICTQKRWLIILVTRSWLYMLQSHPNITCGLFISKNKGRRISGPNLIRSQVTVNWHTDVKQTSLNFPGYI